MTATTRNIHVLLVGFAFSNLALAQVAASENGEGSVLASEVASPIARALDDRAMRSVWGDRWKPLDARPTDIISDSDQRERIVSELLGCSPLDEYGDEAGFDEFELRDCKKRATDLKGRESPLYLEFRVVAENDELKYDFKRKGWVIGFTDDNFGGLSVWMPTVADSLHAERCKDGGNTALGGLVNITCYPRSLPVVHKKFSLFVPMGEDDARKLNRKATLRLLVSPRKGAQWSRRWTYPRAMQSEFDNRVHEASGVLVNVHAARLELGCSWQGCTPPGDEAANPTWWGAN